MARTPMWGVQHLWIVPVESVVLAPFLSHIWFIMQQFGGFVEIEALGTRQVLLLPVEGDTTVLRGLERLVPTPAESTARPARPQLLTCATEAKSVGSSGTPLLLRTLVAALAKVEDHAPALLDI